ncbi:MAG: HAMP domain-containing histidine kinase [Clostridia bacterium]|nr:HAMP domain-containing histidine kinase [Clostridia bacterium]
MATISKRTDKARRPESLRERIVVVFAAILLTVLLVINIYPQQAVKRQMTETARKDMIKDAATLASALSNIPELNGSNIGSAVSVLNILSENRRVLVVSDGAVVLFDSVRSQSLLGNVVLYSEILGALSGNDCFYSRFEGGAINKWAAVPVTRGGITLGAVYIYENDEAGASLLADLSSNIRIVSAIVAVAAMIAVLLFTHDMGKRLSKLLTGVKEAGAGNFKYRIDMPGDDELKMIAEEFNSLSGQIQSNEKARQQFISDSSHELKTPLAAIKLLSDSIVNNDNISREEIKEFLGDISGEIVRLTRISESLISINQALASDDVALYPCDLSETARKVKELLKVTAQAAEVTVNVDADGAFFVSGTSDGFYHIIFNLTENAIKYNKKGGTVDLSLSRGGGKVTMRVSDTGIGIPEHEQEHVFERFFRVDKMRSRATGGTGLGLSIVKEWVDRFGGDISMKSVYGKGTVFTVVFPESEDPK